jgi:hypothetical protein
MTAKALRAGFQRFIQRSAPLPVGWDCCTIEMLKQLQTAHSEAAEVKGKSAMFEQQLAVARQEAQDARAELAILQVKVAAIPERARKKAGL